MIDHRFGRLSVGEGMPDRPKGKALGGIIPLLQCMTDVVSVHHGTNACHATVVGQITVKVGPEDVPHIPQGLVDYGAGSHAEGISSSFLRFGVWGCWISTA
jgi:hypothetical protein